jgi:hypothetical protein
MKSVDATWDDRLRRFKYRIPGVGWAVAEQGHTTYVSSNEALGREARLVASLVGARLPREFQLVVTR